MPPGNASSSLDELRARVEELEGRVGALERLPGRQPVHPHLPAARLRAAVLPEEASPASRPFQVFSTFGRAILGMAGAYLLRAIAESGSVAAWIPFALAVSYAAGWLIWATRQEKTARLAQTIYALTAGTILVPLLWEATVRFRIVEPPAAAGVVTAFAVLALVLGWRGQNAGVVWIGTITALCSSIVLMIASRALLPFTLGMLLVALVCETASFQGRWPFLRAVTAAVTDLEALIVAVILGDPGSIPPEYQAASGRVLLAVVAAPFVIYAGSLAVRSLVLRARIRVLEAAQFGLVTVLAGWGVARITGGSGLPALGVCCLALGAASYVCTFGPPARAGERFNIRFYAVCGAGLVGAGSILVMPVGLLVVWLCLAAVLSAGLGVRAGSAVLEAQSVAYLCGAAVTSGSLGYSRQALAGASPSAPEALPILAGAAALLCAAMVSRIRGEHAGERILRLLPAILGAYAGAGIAAGTLAGLMARGGALAAPQLAVMRTVVTSAAALLLAYAGARWQRSELVWMAYAAAALGSLKLAVEDLRLGTAWSLAASLVVYGAVLLAIPRVARGREPRE